jgi:hypothetical protein
MRYFGLLAFVGCLFFSVQEHHAPAQQSFAQTLYPVLEKAACRSCHNPDGVASATRLVFPETNADNAQIEAFGLALAVLVERANPSASLLLSKPVNRVAHAGGQRIKPGSEEEKALQLWVERLARLTPDEITRAQQTRENTYEAKPKIMLRRLTHSQYNNTILDLLNDQSAPANQFPPEDFLNGFKTQYQAQTLSPLLVEAYSAAAERLARNAFAGGDRRSLIPCKPSPSCRTRFVREFGLKAFRRPLTTDEQKRYEALFARESDFYQGAPLFVEAVLQSPAFLFRLEETDNATWRPYVTASRLAYTLWDTMPDAALLASAARNELNSSQAVEAAARRMLDDPRAKQALDEFVAQWLRFDRLLTAGKDRRRFPGFNRETAFAMTEEARTFIADLVWNDRDFTQIFTADYSFANADLAAIYGVTAPAKEFDRIQFPANSERAGLLGQTLFLALTAKPDETSLTARGLYVREQFLCQHVAEPPPGVNTNLPDVTEAKPQTNRDRLREHVTNPSCATCHNLIDPIGYGFEKFDAIGARRDTFKLRIVGAYDGGHNTAPPKTIELPLDTTGYVAGLPDSKFNNPRELGALLARSPNCQECITRQYFRYTAGRLEMAADRALLRQVNAAFKQSQFRFKELMIALVRNQEFDKERRN